MFTCFKSNSIHTIIFENNLQLDGPTSSIFLYNYLLLYLRNIRNIYEYINISDVSACKPYMSECIPDMSECITDVSECIPEVSECISNASECEKNSNVG